MKTLLNFKSPLIQASLLVAFLLVGNSCKQKSPDTKESAEKMNDAKFDSNKQEKDAEFVVKATEINLEEVVLGKLAQQKGSSSHVVALGKMMQEQHDLALNELKALALTKSIVIPAGPTDKINEAYSKLNEKTGLEFDKAYANMMVDGHEDAIKVFEKAAEDCQDVDIKSWANAKLPDLRMHLDHSIQCKKECEKVSSKM